MTIIRDLDNIDLSVNLDHISKVWKASRWSMTTPTTIVLADDHEILRQGLRALLEKEPDFKVIGEAGDGLEAIALARRLKPEVVVIDVMLPGLNGLDVSHQIKKHDEKTHIVVLSMFADESYVLRALRNGASAYVLKCAAFEVLVHAIREAMVGRTYLSTPLSEQAITVLEKAAGTASLDKYELLTDREKQALQLAAEGLTSAQIADRLGISPRTAETHRANFSKKLGFQSHTDMVAFALRRGLIAKDV